MRMWIQGQWKELLTLGFQVHEEISRIHSPEVADLLANAVDALHVGDGVTAERILKQALAREPDAPDVINNLAAALELQGRMEEGQQMFRANHQRHPDYFFGRTSMARMLAREGKVDQARAMLAPLLTQRRQHITEFAALCITQIEIHIAEMDLKGAQAWLGLWERGNPDHPMQPIMRQKIERGLSKLSSFRR